MKVAFLFPPQWTAAHPAYSMSLLAGQLRRAGHQVSIHDLNLGFYEHALDPRTARFSEHRAVMEEELALTEAQLRLAVRDPSPAAAVAAKKAEVIGRHLKALDKSGAAYERWGRAADSLRRRESFYDPVRFVAAMEDLDQALQHFSLPYFPAEIAWNNFSHPTVPLNLGPMVELCRDSLRNPFFAFMQREVEPLLSRGAGLLAISISAFSQVIPGLTLALMLKERRDLDDLPVHLSLGGNFFTRLVEPLKKSALFFMLFCDSLTVGEGEIPIVQLADALAPAPRDKQALRRVESLMFVPDLGDASGRVEVTPEAAAPDLESLAFQDLAGFPLAKYHSPEPVLAIRASKGCYWGKCLFCDSHYGLPRSTLTVERLVEEMRYLKREYGVRHFELVDQCIPPAYMEAMCDALIAARLDVRWFCNGRTEPGFTPALFTKMRQAGATKVMWGIESGSERLLKLMVKGVSATGRLDILADATAAGLWSFAYIFFGFPTETEAEAMQTVDLIADHTDLIHSYGRSVFTLGKHSPLMDRLAQLGISDYAEDDQELSTNLTFRAPDSLTGQRLMDVVGRCTARARDAYGDPLWMLLRSRETLHLYLAEYGREWVQRYKLASGRAADQDNFVF